MGKRKLEEAKAKDKVDAQTVSGSFGDEVEGEPKAVKNGENNSENSEDDDEDDGDDDEEEGKTKLRNIRIHQARNRRKHYRHKKFKLHEKRRNFSSRISLNYK